MKESNDYKHKIMYKTNNKIKFTLTQEHLEQKVQYDSLEYGV